MSRSIEARQILDAVISGNFTLKYHADQRSAERAITIAEIQNIARTAISWEYQDDAETHLFIGYRSETKGGGFTAVLDEGVWVITVFKRTIKKHQRGKKL